MGYEGEEMNRVTDNLLYGAPFALAALLIFLLSGCLSTSQLETARETYESTHREFEAAGEAMNDAKLAVDEARIAYDKAREEGDGVVAAAAAAALATALEHYDDAINVYTTSRAAYEASRKSFEDAKESNNYVGWILGMVASLFGGGLIGAGVQKRKVPPPIVPTT